MNLARWCAYASGVVGIVGIAFLIAFFGALLTVGEGFGLGELNDAAVVVQYTLMLPIALALRQLLRPHGSVLSLIAMGIGLAGMLAVISLQVLLLTGLLPFEQQIWMVSVAFLVVVVWFVLNAHLGRSTDRLPHGMVLGVLAGLYVGYPFWAFVLGRSLR